MPARCAASVQPRRRTTRSAAWSGVALKSPARTRRTPSSGAGRAARSAAHSRTDRGDVAGGAEWTAVSSNGSAPGGSISAVGCSNLPGTPPATTAGNRVQTAPDAEGTLPGRAVSTCAQGSSRPRPRVRRPRSDPGVSSWTERTSTSNRRTRSTTGPGGTRPLRRLTVAIRTRGPSGTGAGTPRRPRTAAVRTAAAPPASSVAVRERAWTAAARGRTDVAAAYGVNDMAGTRGKPRSEPLARSAAHATHGRASTGAGTRRFPAGAIPARVGWGRRTPDAQGRPHMTSGHLEVETKYDVDEAFVVPDVAGLTGVASVDVPVEHHLEAVYFDTADLRLLRARVTLRRRTGGPDAGWHLKLPAGTARRELHVPLGRAVKKAPTALLEPVAGVVRGEVPRPVATLHTRRVVTALRGPGGELLAEIADDTVTASVPPAGPGSPIQVQAWREVEVELGVGDDALAAAVGERLTDAGARPSPSASKVGRVLGERLAEVAGPVPQDREPTDAGEFVLGALARQIAALQAADVLLRTDQPDAVHQIRVAARRLRSTLSAFRGVLDRAATGPIRDELSWMGGQLAEARDAEVALEHLRAVVRAQPDELVLGPVGARL